MKERKVISKGIAVFVALAMVFGMMPGTAALTASAGAAADAAETLHSIGLFQGVGDDAQGNPNFELGRAATRAEGVVMLIRLLGAEEEALSGNYPNPFVDAPEWAAPYIGYAFAMGYTRGVSDTYFNPSGTLTAAQYLTFVLRALGYDENAGDFTWSSAWTLTDRLGITNGEFNSGNNTIIRGAIAIVSLNTLNTPIAGTETLLIQQLIEQGAVPEDAAETVTAAVEAVEESATPPAATTPPTTTTPPANNNNLGGGTGNGGTTPPANIAVTSITVTGAGGATAINTNDGELQMSANVLPTNATNRNVTWSVTPATGVASISSGGLLHAETNGTVTVRATAQDGSGVFGELEITISGQLAKITLTAGTPTPAVGGTSVMTTTLTYGGSPVSGENIIFTWKVKGGSMAQQNGATTDTDASGQATWTLDNTAFQGGHRTITVTAALQSDPAIYATADVRFGDALPAGIIAMAGSNMNWANASAYAAAQGGRLPLINGSPSLASVPAGASIDGFGSIGAAWPAGLPNDMYWTGTEHSAVPGNSFWIGNASGNVGNPQSGSQTVGMSNLRVVVVP